MAPGASRPGSPEVVFTLPLYLQLKGRRLADQVHLLTRISMMLDVDGRTIHAAVNCDTIQTPFPRSARNPSVPSHPDAEIFVPDDLLQAPIYVVFSKIKGLRLKTRVVLQVNFFEWSSGLEIQVDIRTVDKSYTVTSKTAQLEERQGRLAQGTAGDN
ncbi:hypothetical protein C8Q70DRAFT_1052264 [Cubamyces menziesii]|uniref:Uncharacterized protein n=1 Tax=Trametes cubensis TaxID=1111947 RepID=A0AAD7X946_9APHY|nr:hypothetical protein C8Q70DRAFT_1052264 [Cubamyces menziesii]KAJ8473519.1 hypothetical protein ONZ51_g7828 [Trametes cubensis]